jgi:periplasmic divalent cation tolerance protein
MHKNTSLIEVLTTVPSKNEAQKISSILLKENLVACVQIFGPIESMYRWKKKKESSREWCLVAKTKRHLFLLIEKRILQLHSYEVPEIIAFEATHYSKKYFQWVSKSVK